MVTLIIPTSTPKNAPKIRLSKNPNFPFSSSPTFQRVSCVKDKTEDSCQVPRVCWYIDLHKRETERDGKKKEEKGKKRTQPEVMKEKKAE
jgi:hypothetical protein